MLFVPRIIVASLAALFLVIGFASVSLRAQAAQDTASTNNAAPSKREPVVAARPKPPRFPIAAARPEKLAPWGIEVRTPWTTSRVVGSPEPPLPYRLARSFPKLSFKEPVYMQPEPGTDRVWVLELKGRIVAFNPREAEPKTEEVFVVPESVAEKSSANYYSFAFHPKYIENGRVILFCDEQQKVGEPNEHDRVSWYDTSGTPRKVLPESRRIIIEWASAGHAGGGMEFGPDGMLYLTTGDGTGGSDLDNTGQDITDLRGAVLRIDVDHPDKGHLYSVPNDNPFVHLPGARPEIWAFGLRAPWRMSFDRHTGNLWVGEVGQDLWEMIHLIRKGGNYGWSVMEGTHPFYPERKVGPAPILPPIVEHSHSEARSISGGYVYHGKRLPELNGMYVYCDYATGTVWAFRYENDKVTERRTLADSSYMVAAFGLDQDEELYLLALSGELLQLEKNPDVGTDAKFPRKLSDTGVFSSVKDQTPAPGVIPYTVNAPQWCDGAHVQRFLAVPNDGTIEPVASRGWNFTDGSVLVQTLSLEMEPGNATSRQNVETRMLTKQGGEWAAYTYAWNDNRTDAELIEKEGLDRKLTIRDTKAPGGARTQTWRYAARTECMGCHSRAANYALGMTSLQMNKDHDFGSIIDNQMRTLNHIGLFKPALDTHPRTLRKLVNPYDPRAPLDARARSYLHTNCSHCHVSDGGGNAKMELEFITEPHRTRIFGVTPLQGNFDIQAADLIAPGDPYRSVMYYRISKLGSGRMPQVGSWVVDTEARKLFQNWISSLPPNIGEPPSGAEEQKRSRTPKQYGENAAKYAAQKEAEERAATEAKRAALEAARQLREQNLEAVGLLKNGSASPSGETRIEAANQLLSTTIGALTLLQALDENSIHSPLREDVIALGSAHADGDIRDLFERFLPEERRVKRLGPVIQPESLLATAGDAERGRQLFFSNGGILCKNCHQIKEVGRAVGPELTQIGKKYNRQQILENLLEPSKTIEEKYLTYVVETTSGKVHTGLLVERTPQVVTLKDVEGKMTSVPANEIEEMEVQRKSLMPEQILRDLTAQQAADLLEFLSELK